jgi:hypothetical protein
MKILRVGYFSPAYLSLFLLFQELELQNYLRNHSFIFLFTMYFFWMYLFVCLFGHIYLQYLFNGGWDFSQRIFLKRDIEWVRTASDEAYRPSTERTSLTSSQYIKSMATSSRLVVQLQSILGHSLGDHRHLLLGLSLNLVLLHRNLPQKICLT